MDDGLRAVTVVVDRGMKKTSFFMQCAGLCFPVVLVLPQRFFFLRPSKCSSKHAHCSSIQPAKGDQKNLPAKQQNDDWHWKCLLLLFSRGRKLGWGSCREKYLLKYSEVPLPPALPELRAAFICLLCFMNSVDFSIIIPPVSECEGGE